MTTSKKSDKSLGLPDFLPDIYRAKNILDVVKNHIDTLEQEIVQNPGNLNAKLLKNSFEEYLYSMATSSVSKKNRSYLNQIQSLITKLHPYLFVKTSYRFKGILSFYNKARIKLSNGVSLDTIKDLHACRTIIDSSAHDSENLIKLCYQIMDEIIDNMINFGLIPCDFGDTKNTDGFDKAKFPNIVVPSRSYLSEKNRKYVRDYILHPKAGTGYQSLHVVFKDKFGKYFEYQVRTQLMDYHCEFGEAAHHSFKEAEAKDIPALNIDRSKINMAGYMFINGNLIDEAGLEKSSDAISEIYRGNPKA